MMDPRKESPLTSSRSMCWCLVKHVTLLKVPCQANCSFYLRGFDKQKSLWFFFIFFIKWVILVMMGQMMNPNMVHVRQPFMGMGMQMQPRMMMMQPGMRMMRPGFQPY